MQILDGDLHVINGEAAAGSWKQAFGSIKSLAIQTDSLSCGPTPRCDDLNTWKNIRKKYLQQWHADIANFSLSENEFELLNSLTRLQQDENIYIWAATGLQDQLLLPFVVYLADCEQIKIKNIKFIQFSKPAFSQGKYLAMGELNPQAMSQPPQAISLTNDDIQFARKVWQAYSHNTAEKLIAITREKYNQLPYLLPAIKSLIFRYPYIQSGLDIWDWTLLQNVEKHFPSCSRTIGYTLGYTEGPDWVGDSYLFYRLKQLAKASHPPLILQGDLTSMRTISVQLTEFGQAILNQEACFYPDNEIDAWVGGTHLCSKQKHLWMLDDEQLIQINDS